MDKYSKKGALLLKRIYTLERRIPFMNKDTILKDVMIVNSRLQDIKMEFMSEVRKISKNPANEYKVVAYEGVAKGCEPAQRGGGYAGFSSINEQ